MTDESLRRLFVPAARAGDPAIEVEPRGQTAAGHVYEFGARRVPTLERMERHGSLTHRQGAAGRRLYQDYVFGIVGARERDAATANGSPSGYADSQIDAAGRCRAVKERLGPRLWPLCFAIACDDVSVPDYARHRGLNPTSTVAVLRIALDMAADVYGMD